MNTANDEYDILLTVFTPTYNRAHTLPRTYKSMQHQRDKRFIWLIVDDGSTDNTAELVKKWKQEESEFEIRYVYKENGGMHTAHNTAYEMIDTELNICIDSDDALAEGAVETILSKWEEIKDKNYAGMIGLDADFEGTIIGTHFPCGMKETTLSGLYAKGGRGDKKLVYRTAIIKSVPAYPVFEGEKYVALAYKYRLIDQSYQLAVIDGVLCNVEYQTDGSSKTMWRQYYSNPKGFACWRLTCMYHPTGAKRLVVDCIHYVAESVLARNQAYFRESPYKLLTALCTLPGVLLSWIIRIKNK